MPGNPAIDLLALSEGLVPDVLFYLPQCFAIGPDPCGPQFHGALLLNTQSVTQNDFKDNPLPTVFDDEEDFKTQLANFVNGTTLYADVNVSATVYPYRHPDRRYQASLFCTSAVSAGFQGSCYGDSNSSWKPNITNYGTAAAAAVFQGPLIPCYDMCFHAIETLAVAVSELVPSNGTETAASAVKEKRDWLTQYRSMCSGFYAAAYSPFVENYDNFPRNCTMAINGTASTDNESHNELLTCGFSGPDAMSLKYRHCGYGTTKPSGEWCCSQTSPGPGNLTSVIATWDDALNTFKIGADRSLSDHTTSQATVYFSLIFWFVFVGLVLHFSNWYGRRIENTREPLTEDEFERARAKSSHKPEFTPVVEHAPANYDRFFDVMGLEKPNAGGVYEDLNFYFDTSARGFPQAVNPYAPLDCPSGRRPPLLALDDLAPAEFTNKAHNVQAIYSLSGATIPTPGLLKYLRQVGTPRIEEVMFSYSWEAGVQENVRGVARCLMESGIGVWLDVMKLQVSDDKDRITRTVASHTRFVIVVLTDKYAASAPCFIEFLEAINAPNAQERVMVWVPGNTVGVRVNRIYERLKISGIHVFRDFDKFVNHLNTTVIHSNEFSHLQWWKNYVGTTAGIPFEATAPSPKQTKHLSRYNFKLFGSVPRNAVKISNVWLASSLRSTGTNAASFPLGGGWFGALILVLVVFMLCVNLSQFVIIWSITYIQSSSVDDGLPNTPQYADIAVMNINIIMEGLVLFLVLFVSSLGADFDNRFKMSTCLRPLIATFNIRQHTTPASEPSIFPRVGAVFKAGTVGIAGNVDPEGASPGAPSIRQRAQAMWNARFGGETEKEPEASPLPKVKVLVHAFGKSNKVADTLTTFLKYLDLFPSETNAFDAATDDFGSSKTGFEVFVPVFVFGGSDPEMGAQVKAFEQIVHRCKLRLEDCVLILAGPEKNVEFPGFFDIPVVVDGRVNMTMGNFLLLVEHNYTDGTFASDVVFHIGLRVKEALKRIAKHDE
ncbi:hypothetical protein HDU98_000517 [Podochytrium sp. JEL0797]|nr:hypothetical protein HDU98_000517 [Podochytrium sp. JEL0797]